MIEEIKTCAINVSSQLVFPLKNSQASTYGTF